MRLFLLMMTVAVACKPKDEVDASWDEEEAQSNQDAEAADDEDDDAEDSDEDENSDDDDSPTGMEYGIFLGQMNADWQAEAAPSSELPDGVSLEASCSGGARFEMDNGMSLVGESGCSASTTSSVLSFDLEGTQTDLTLSGTMELEFYDDILVTDFTGTRNGDDVEITFDQLHENAGSTFNISGTITASLVE